MTIAENAVSMIKERKLDQMLSEMIENLVRESKKLGVSEEGLVEKIRQIYEKE